MDRCYAHRKDLIGDCIWCGKKLCVLCIARKEGRKLYCELCSASLGPPRRSIPKVVTKESPVAVAPKKPYRDTDGFIDFTGR